MIVEATKDTFWASGLLPIHTAQRPINEWPGSNRLGQLMMEMRATHVYNDKQDISVEVDKIPTSSSQTEAYQLASQLIDHVLTENPSCTSPELLGRADALLDDQNPKEKTPNSPKKSITAAKAKSFFKSNRSKSPKSDKRKAISPVQQLIPEEKRRNTQDPIGITLKNYFKKTKDNIKPP